MASTIVTPQNFIPSEQLLYTKPKVNANNGKAIGILNKHTMKSFYMSTPLMLTWGVNERVDEDSGRVSYDMALQFQPEKHASIAKFLDAMKGLEEKVKNDCVKNSKAWFGKSNMSREVIDVLMYPILKYPRKKDGSGEPDMDRDPTLKLKIPYWEGKFNTELYDTNSKPIFNAETDMTGKNFENSKIAISAGANILVSGTTIFKDNEGDIKKNIETLKTN